MSTMSAVLKVLVRKALFPGEGKSLPVFEKKWSDFMIRGIN
jgi:hypothetical protein